MNFGEGRADLSICLLSADREWVNGHGTPLESFNPATEEIITSVHTADANDIELAVTAAREAFETTWGLNVAGVERGRLLYKFADVSNLLRDRVVAGTERYLDGE